MTLRLRATHTLVLATFTVVLFTTNTTPCKKKKQTNLLDLVLTRIQCNKKWKRMICLLKARKNTLRLSRQNGFAWGIFLIHRVLYWQWRYEGFSPISIRLDPRLLATPPPKNKWHKLPLILPAMQAIKRPTSDSLVNKTNYFPWNLTLSIYYLFIQLTLFYI